MYLAYNQRSFQLILELVIFGLAAAALYLTDHPVLTWVFGLLYVINKILIAAHRQTLPVGRVHFILGANMSL